MSSPAAFEILSDGVPHLVRIRYLGHVTAAGMQACREAIEQILPRMQPGFTVVTDLSGLASMDLECAPHLTKIMDLAGNLGVGTVVRIIPDPAKDIGFNILSIIHYRGHDVRIITCETREEAERALAPATS